MPIHKTLPRWSTERTWSKLVDLFCGYGEKPQRVISFSALFIVLCALGYFAIGVNGGGRVIGFSANASTLQNIFIVFSRKMTG